MKKYVVGCHADGGTWMSLAVVCSDGRELVLLNSRFEDAEHISKGMLVRGAVKLRDESIQRGFTHTRHVSENLTREVTKFLGTGTEDPPGWVGADTGLNHYLIGFGTAIEVPGLSIGMLNALDVLEAEQVTKVNEQPYSAISRARAIIGFLSAQQDHSITSAPASE